MVERANDAAGLVERLRRTPLYEGHGEDTDLGKRAATTITRLLAEQERLRTRLNTIAVYPITGTQNMDADNMALLARAALQPSAGKGERL